MGRPEENYGRIAAEALLADRAAVVIETADIGYSAYKPWLTANSSCMSLGPAMIQICTALNPSSKDLLPKSRSSISIYA